MEGLGRPQPASSLPRDDDGNRTTPEQRTATKAGLTLPTRRSLGRQQQPCTPTCSAARVSAELPLEEARTR